MTTTVHDVKQRSLDKNLYFTVQGKIMLGFEDPISLDFGTVKEDVVIIDNTGYIALKLWNEIIDKVKSDYSYSITCCRMRRFDGCNLLTTTPKTVVTPIQLEVKVPQVNFFAMQLKVRAEKIVGVASGW